jgi:alkylation response protein AidB-like acyl-CoA dehydrogenase
MDFGFTPEQEQLKVQVRRFLDAECPLERVRTLMTAEEPYDAGLWKQMAELGWHSLVVPEAYDGLGLHWEDVVVVAEEMGRSLFPSPFIAGAVAARAIATLGSEEQKKRWLPPIAAGELIATLAVAEPGDVWDPSAVQAQAKPDRGGVTIRGTKMFVPDGCAAGLLLVAVREADGVSLYGIAADAPGVAATPLKLVDRTHRAAKLTLDGVQLGASERLGAAGAAADGVRRLLDAATVAESAQMVGAGDAAVALAAEYAKVRKQFGHPIGRFQGVKHVLAEIHVAVESSRSLTYYASWALDNLPDAARFVSMAKAYATDALDRAGEECVQIHGAIGFTWECDAQLYYKRGRFCRNWLGSAEHHRERVLSAQGL